MSRMVLLLCTLALSLWTVQGLFTFVNFKCSSLDPTFVKFETCLIKAQNRSFKYITMKVNILQKPVTNFMVNVCLYRKISNYYVPSYLNVTADGCKFLESTDSYPIMKFFYYAFKPFTNMNHTCPYDHDLLVEKFNTNSLEEYSKVIPFPKGNYMIDSNWMNNNMLRGNIKLYLDWN